MNEFLKKMITKVSALWAGWSKQQRLISVGVVILLIGVIIALFRVTASPVLVPVINAPIRDEGVLERIVFRIEEENVRVTVTANNVIMVADEPTARRMRTILFREDLIPSNIDPWDIFDRDRWTITDFERRTNLRRAQERMIIEHLRAIDDIDSVGLQIAWPPETIFLSDQKPVTASVRITPKHGSDITIFPQNRKKIEGIQKLLQYAVVGLLPENITISDNRGVRLNDFEGMVAADRLALIEQESRILKREEAHYRETILTTLQRIYSPDRVRDLNIKIEMDMSKMTIGTTEHFPIEIKPRTPGLPYDDSELRETLIIGQTESKTEFTGTGFNPEGPAGVEGHVPPSYTDMSNMYGTMRHSMTTTNFEVNRRDKQEERSPSHDRITVSVNIDGVWRWKFDAKGNPVITPEGTIDREYTEIPPEELRRVEGLIRDAIGFNSARGDSVTVHNIQIDRTEEFRAEDQAFFRQKQMQTTIIAFISGLTLLLFGFMLFRMISREMERRRRIAEEERARREQMLRESAMAEAEDGTEVSISYEERTRMELMENAINMAKEHPDDAAQLIRTWILEE